MGERSEAVRARLARVPWRVWAGAAVLVLVALLGKVTGLADRLDGETMRHALLAAGPCGVLWFIGAFSAGNVLNVPGIVFISVSALVYGPVAGAMLALSGAVVASSTSFCVARRLRGRSPEAEDDAAAATEAAPTLGPAWAQRVFARLEEHPVLVIAALRCVMIVSPPLNYALAFSSVRHRDYVLGNLLGLAGPIAVISFGASRAAALVA